jgi:hypothetical protein
MKTKTPLNHICASSLSDLEVRSEASGESRLLFRMDEPHLIFESTKHFAHKTKGIVHYTDIALIAVSLATILILYGPSKTITTAAPASNRMG